MSEKTRIDLLAVPQSTGSLLYGLFDLFSMVRRDWSALVDGDPRESPFEVRIVGRAPGVLGVENGLHVNVQGDLDGQPDIVCIPDLAVHPTEVLSGRYEPELDFLRRARERGAIVATACTGALLLAEAGLLRGQPATTHWLFCPRLAGYPEVEVREKQALVIADGGHLVMAGAATSWQDLGLYLVARFAGVEEAMRTARLGMMSWHEGGQQPFAGVVVHTQTEDAVIARAQLWVAEHYEAPNPVAQMLADSGLPERTFQRRFRAVTGMTPIEYVHAVRLEEAKQMLEVDAHSVEAIALEVGYEDASFFGRLFRRHVGMTPVQYRRRFGGLRRRLDEALSA
jgi:transcriptional regulator GlxA family with amidase domain